MSSRAPATVPTSRAVRAELERSLLLHCRRFPRGPNRQLRGLAVLQRGLANRRWDTTFLAPGDPPLTWSRCCLRSAVLSTVLIPIPSTGFDPTETGVPWKRLSALGHSVQFATPDGRPGQADPRMVTGHGLGILKGVLRADRNGRQAYAEMLASHEFAHPRRHMDVRVDDFDGLVLPGGHAPGMRPYLESSVLQALVSAAFEAGRPVGAICHGVVLAARSKSAGGRSVLYRRRTTALTRVMELTAWALT